MTKTTWGRKETIVWPYYRPLYTYGTVLLCLVLTGLFVYCRFSFSSSALQGFYAPLYVRTSLVGSLFATRRDNYRVLFAAGSLRLLPRRSETSRAWTATEWAEKRQGWVFLTSLPAEREALRPLQSLWIDWLVLRLLNEPTEGQKRVWFVIDELASLQKLPQLHTAITENRKSNNPVVLGFQGKAQLEYLYGHLAEVMLSQPATSVWLTTKEPNAGEWVSKFIGKVEIERLRETHFDGTRNGRNFTLDRQIEPLVMESEISGLADLHAFMKYQNFVTHFSFPYFNMSQVAKGFELRERPDDKLPYEARTAPKSDADVASSELKQEPQPAAPPQTQETPKTPAMQQEPVWDPNETQNLILRG